MSVINVKLDEHEILDTATRLAAFRKVLFSQCMYRAMDRLANGAAEIVRQAYESSYYVPGENYTPSVRVTTNVDRKGFSFTVTANGEQVGFLEFGAGAMTAETHPLADQAPFPVFMGSWSNSPEGAGTWLKWLMAGKDPMEYPYNREPRFGFYTASEWVKRNCIQYIREEFEGVMDL